MNNMGKYPMTKEEYDKMMQDKRALGQEELLESQARLTPEMMELQMQKEKQANDTARMERYANLAGKLGQLGSTVFAGKSALQGGIETPDMTGIVSTDMQKQADAGRESISRAQKAQQALEQLKMTKEDRTTKKMMDAQQYAKGEQSLTQGEQALTKGEQSLQRGDVEMKQSQTKLDMLQRDFSNKEKQLDPNSTISQIARQVFKNTYNQDIPESASFADLNSLRPEFKETLGNKMELYKINQKSIVDQKKALSGVSKEQQKATLDVYGTYKTDPEMGELISTSSSLSRFSNISDTSAGDIGRVFMFMKSFDPSSVVRESEFALGQTVGGMWDMFKSKIDKITGVGQLTPDQRKEMFDVMRSIQRGVDKRLAAKNAEFAKRYEAFGVPKSTYEPFLWNTKGFDKEKVQSNSPIRMKTPDGKAVNVKPENVEKALEKGLTHE